jgi:hypothetical protein
VHALHTLVELTATALDSLGTDSLPLAKQTLQRQAVVSWLNYEKKKKTPTSQRLRSYVAQKEKKIYYREFNAVHHANQC